VTAPDERIVRVLAANRCRDVHGNTYTEPWCESCRGWAAHVAAALTTAGVGVIADAKAEAVLKAADEIQALHPGEVKNSVIFLRDRAARVESEAGQ
jgi:hypothetical protein